MPLPAGGYRGDTPRHCDGSVADILSEIAPYLCCPDDGTPLTVAAGLCCPRCARKFRVIQDRIIDLLPGVPL